jgi:hypothetical protein
MSEPVSESAPFPGNWENTELCIKETQTPAASAGNSHD